MIAREGLSDVDRALLHATRSAWQRHPGSDLHRQAMRDLVLRLTDSGVRQQTIAAELGVTTATVGMWRSGRRKPRRTNRARRPPSADELHELRLLFGRLSFDGIRYAWSTAAGHEFLSAAHTLIADGVSALQLAELIAGHAQVGPETILRKISGPRKQLRRGPTITQRNRTRKTPDEARVPNRSRPVTPEEWARLLELHAAVRVGGGMYPSARRKELERPLQLRDREIVRLWSDRVADAHIADLLGMSDAAITQARRRFRRTTGSAPVRRRASRQAPRRRYRHLTPAEAELLRAAYDRIQHGPYRYGSNLFVPTFGRLVADQQKSGVQLIEIAATVGISRTTLRSLMKAYRAGQKTGEPVSC